MNNTKLVFFTILLFSLSACNSPHVRKYLQGVSEKPLTQQEVRRGLREALSVGASNASQHLHKKNAFYRNKLIRIPFPEEANTVKTAMNKIGLNSLVSKVELSLNRAAEAAAVKAKPIFLSAIKKMTISDAIKILRGNKDAATQYLKKNTHRDLSAAFQPVVGSALKQVNATRYWADLMGRYNKIPFVQKVNPDLKSYVTTRALRGLFLEVAKEEAKIRKEPAARVTALLQRVFGTPA